MILVTGATGTVGSETVRLLADAGHRVRAMVHDPAKAASLGAGIDTVVADLGEPATLAPAFAGVERVFVISPVHPQLETFEANAYRAAAEAGVKHIVKLSNFAAGSFDTLLMAWHQASEDGLRAQQVPWTVLGPTRFMTDTPFPFMWSSIVNQGLITESTADGRITVIDPRDVAAVAAKVLTTPGHEGRSYKLTSDDSLTGAEIAEKISAAVGRPVSFVDAPPDVVHQGLVAAGVPEFVAEMLLQYFFLVRDGYMQLTTTVADLLGRPPRSYEEWLKDNAEARVQQAQSA
jgi:uncharacterized protein YbjT (DUF2867 family)